MEDFEDGVQTADPEEKEKPRHARLWHVVLLNDDFTPMDFVVDILMKHFALSEDAATAVMFDVHKKGKGIAGTYSRDVAETKGSMVVYEAREAGHPLAATIEPAE